MSEQACPHCGDQIHWSPSANEAGWKCCACGHRPGEPPGYDPARDRACILDKVDSILHIMHAVNLIHVSNGTHGESIASSARRGTGASLTSLRTPLSSGPCSSRPASRWTWGGASGATVDGHTTLTVGLFGSLTPDPCKGCNGTARDIREAAMLVLAAAPPIEAETAAEARAFGRDALHVEADRMLPDLEGKRPHDPDLERLGEWLALWLAGKRDGTADGVERLDALTSDRSEAGESYSFPDGEVIEARLV